MPLEEFALAPPVPPLYVRRGRKDMLAATRASKSTAWVAPATFSAVFVGYLVVVFMNLPPAVKSNHVSVNWNMISIAGIGAIGSASALERVINFS